MKRLAPWIAFVVGITVTVALSSLFNATQPKGIRLTRGDAVPVADAEARKLGIPVDQSWATLYWTDSPLIAKELEWKSDLRRRASDDPVLGPRLGGYKRTYYRRGAEKFQPYGYVVVDHRSGAILMERRMMRIDEPGAKATEAQLRPRAEAFVKSRNFRGAPSPQFESARPNVMRSRTDWVFRYRVRSDFPIGNVVPYLNIYFNGEQLAGFALIEEYADGRPFRNEQTGEEISSLFARFATSYALLLILIVIFLRKYHAGEAGVSTGSIIFAAVVLLALAIDWIIGPAGTEGNQMGSLDAQKTAAVQMGFKFLLYDLPLAVLAFFAWSVGESYARERWGERLASFDSILRRDPLNATAGRSVLHGVLFAPAVAAAAFVVAAIPLMLHIVHPADGTGTDVQVKVGGPLAVALFAALDAIVYPVLALFLLAWTHRRRVLPVGVLAVIAIGMVGAVCQTPIEPFLRCLIFSFGGISSMVAIFLGYDLLTTAVALFGGSLIAMTAPLMSVAEGHQLAQLVLLNALPIGAGIIFAAAALMTRREAVYTYEDLAPHVRRIVERERVKAEIDAANRIQAALLPEQAPHLEGATVASHYRAATEIGGDYFDFLPQPNGEIGIAFGDVSGHGLTSGIVMAMAKAALLVQVDVDPSPRRVMNVLNEIVIKTAPRRILMTFFFGLLDSAAQRLRFSSAGHLDPYVYRAGQRRIESLSSWGFPLGVRRREPFREHVVEFTAGDRLILYSDGLIEAIDDDGEPFGFDRFERVLLDNGHLSAEEIKKTLLGSIRKFTRNRPPEDDQTLVVVSFEAAGEQPEEAEAAYATAT